MGLKFRTHLLRSSIRDLVLYFDYEDFDGDTVVEKSGRGYDGAIQGKVTQSNDGKFGKAAHFASGSFLDLDGPNIKPDDIPTEGMSIVAWINVEADLRHGDFQRTCC